jgi:hypothetical protein
LVGRMAAANPLWGAPRIHGVELPRFGGGFTAFAHTGNSSRLSYAMGDK